MGTLINRFRNLIEYIDHRFEHSRLRPAWDTVSTFFFSLASRTPIGGTHLRDNTDLKRYMSVVMGCVAPCALMAVYLFGWRCLAVVAMCYALGIVIELGFAIHNREEVTEGMFVTCILFPLILPPTIPYWMAAVGLAVGIILGKEVFGGTGKNIFNPAMVGRTFIAVTFPVAMASRWVEPYSGWPGGFAHWTVTVDAITVATPLSAFRNGAPVGIGDLFFGTTSGSMGETSALLIIAGGIVLVLTRVANWRLVTGTIAGALALATVMHAIDPEQFAAPIYHLLSGGLLFGAFFMVTDPVSAPFTTTAKWIYAVMIGVLTVFIRNLSGYPEGMMFAVLFMNLFAPLLDEIILSIRYGVRRGG